MSDEKSVKPDLLAAERACEALIKAAHEHGLPVGDNWEKLFCMWLGSESLAGRQPNSFAAMTEKVEQLVNLFLALHRGK